MSCGTSPGPSPDHPRHLPVKVVSDRHAGSDPLTRPSKIRIMEVILSILNLVKSLADIHSGYSPFCIMSDIDPREIS